MTAADRHLCVYVCGSTTTATTTAAVSPLHRPIQTTGELTIRVDTEGVSIRTYLGQLPVVVPTSHHVDVDETGHDTSPRANKKTRRSCTVKVEARKLCTALHWPNHATSALLCLIEQEQLVVHVTMEPVGFLTYYVPIQYCSDDEQEEEED
jgi:hypothetical protein